MLATGHGGDILQTLVSQTQTPQGRIFQGSRCTSVAFRCTSYYFGPLHLETGAVSGRRMTAPVLCPVDGTASARARRDRGGQRLRRSVVERPLAACLGSVRPVPSLRKHSTQLTEWSGERWWWWKGRSQGAGAFRGGDGGSGPGRVGAGRGGADRQGGGLRVLLAGRGRRGLALATARYGGVRQRFGLGRSLARGSGTRGKGGGSAVWGRA